MCIYIKVYTYVYIYKRKKTQTFRINLPLFLPCFYLLSTLQEVLPIWSYPWKHNFLNFYLWSYFPYIPTSKTTVATLSFHTHYSLLNLKFNSPLAGY